MSRQPFQDSLRWLARAPWLLFMVVLAVMALFAVMSYEDRRLAAESSVMADIRRTEERLNAWIIDVHKAVRGYRHLAERLRNAPENEVDRRALERLFAQDAKHGGFAYDRPEFLGSIPLGNVFALPSARSRLVSQPEEWVMLRRLFPLMSELLERNPHILGLHYVSSLRDFGAIYPWVSTDTLLTGFGISDMAQMYDRIFSADRRKKRGISYDLRESITWSEPYVDAATGNTTVTVSGQVIAGDNRLTGFLGMDIQLTGLDELLEMRSTLPFDVYLVDDKGWLVAESHHNKEHQHPLAAPLAKYHPKVAHQLSRTLLQQGHLTRANDQLLSGRHLAPSPWRVLFVVPEATFEASVWEAWRSEALAFALALFAMLVAFASVHRWLTGPVVQLALYTGKAEDQSPPAGLPRVWRPWFVLVRRKASAMKRRYRKLLKQLEQLKRRCVEQDASLRSQQAEMQSFLYSISHDLRAPLRGIRGFSQVIEHEFADSLGTAAADPLQRLQACSQRAMQIVEGLLSLSRMSRRALTWKKIHVSQKAQQVLEDKLAQMDVSAETLIEPNMEIVADEYLLEIVLTEVLDNALRFRSEDRPLNVRMGCKTVAGRRRFYVQDNGIGMTMVDEHLPFRPFTTLHPAGRVPVGEGLGLARVLQAVRRMRGNVTIESHVNEGTVVWFWVGSPDAGSENAVI